MWGSTGNVRSLISMFDNRKLCYYHMMLVSVCLMAGAFCAPNGRVIDFCVNKWYIGLKLNYGVEPMDWMLEGLLQGTQFQKLYNRRIETLRQEYDLRKVDIDILYFLFKSGEHNTPKDISGLNLFNKGHISQSIGRMENQQLIYSVQDQDDRRCVHIMLTDKAVKVVEEITALRKQMYNIILKGVTPEEQDVLLKVSRKVNENIKEALEQQVRCKEVRR